MEQQSQSLSGWITTAEAAERLGLTPRRIRQLARLEGKLAYRLVTPRLLLVRKSDVEKYKRGDS